MMAAAHSIFYLMPGWTGILMLIVVWTVFRSFLLKSRRGMQDGIIGGRTMPPPQMHGQVHCPRCSANAPGVASYCPHCGLALNNLPPPIPQRQGAGRRRDQWWVMVIVAIIGLIGLVAYMYWSTPEKAPPPQPPEVT